MSYWQNKVVVVTGGSAGLGREIALAFARQGAQTVVLARDPDKLEQLCQQARESSPPLTITGIQTDVLSEASVQQAIQSILAQWNRIDVWVNNVGRSTRTALMESKVDEYRELMELNFLSAVRCSLAILPHLAQTRGHLVNIGSLASRTGWPLVAPYSASKRALSAFHHQLRLEGPREVHYLEVCPGPLRRSDSGSRYAMQAEKLGKAAGDPGAGVKLKGISPEWLANQIEIACRRRKSELLVPFYSRFLFVIGQIFPRLSDRILLAMRKSDR